MVKKIRNLFVYGTFRRYVELLGIVYFFMLVVLCTLELLILQHIFCKKV
jgi:hypothetical protein